MAKQALGIGTTADDGTGDTLRGGGTKIKENFDELYDLMGDGSDLSSGISATALVVTLTAPAINGVVAGTQTSATITTLTTGDILVADDKYVQFGSGQDVLMGYDETTTDSLKIAATEGAALAITLMADEGDDAGDEWKLNIADGGTMTLGNDINSAGTYVTHLTITPNSTVASSIMAFAGTITTAGNAVATSGDATALAIALG